MRTRMIMAYILLGVSLLQYQNCAPGPMEEQNPELVDGIDVVSAGSIFFPQNKVSATMERPVIVLGVCEQTGALISWKLSSADGQNVERGLAECDRGSFEVMLGNEWQNHCDETLKLAAALGIDAYSEAEIIANCQ